MKDLIGHEAEFPLALQQIDHRMENPLGHAQGQGSGHQPDPAGMDQRMRAKRDEPFLMAVRRMPRLLVSKISSPATGNPRGRGKPRAPEKQPADSGDRRGSRMGRAPEIVQCGFSLRGGEFFIHAADPFRQLGQQPVQHWNSSRRIGVQKQGELGTGKRPDQ